MIFFENVFKGNAQFLFLRNPQRLSVNVCLMKTIKKDCQELCVFLKVAAFVTFAISIMVLFEIHQRFKG